MIYISCHLPPHENVSKVVWLLRSAFVTIFGSAFLGMDHFLASKAAPQPPWKRPSWRVLAEQGIVLDYECPADLKVLEPSGHVSAGIDPVALEGAEDGIEAALLDLIAAFQALNHFPVCMQVF